MPAYFSRPGPLPDSAVVFLVSALAGFLGELTGLGGGVAVTPVLTLLLGVDIHCANGAWLASAIATSSGAAAYVKEGFSNVRAGMLLEIAATAGAVLRAFGVGAVEPHEIACLPKIRPNDSHYAAETREPQRLRGLRHLRALRFCLRPCFLCVSVSPVVNYSTGLLSTPMPSISTSTVSPGDSLRVLPGVPV